MIRQIQIHNRAERDTYDVVSWLRQRSPMGAAAWLNALETIVAIVASNPDQFPQLSEAKRGWKRKVHQAPFRTSQGRWYRAVYDWNDTQVRLLRVRSPGQKPLRKRDLPDD